MVSPPMAPHTCSAISACRMLSNIVWEPGEEVLQRGSYRSRYATKLYQEWVWCMDHIWYVRNTSRIMVSTPITPQACSAMGLLDAIKCFLKTVSPPGSRAAQDNHASLDILCHCWGNIKWCMDHVWQGVEHATSHSFTPYMLSCYPGFLIELQNHTSNRWGSGPSMVTEIL